jgi:hypothetical protein
LGTGRFQFQYRFQSIDCSWLGFHVWDLKMQIL